MFIDPAGLGERETYRLLSGGVVPRPIAWTATSAPNGARNLAPFSFFTVVSRRPPMVSITVEDHAEGRAKDTLRNINAIGEFTISVVSVGAADRMHLSSLEHPPDVDEFDVAGVAAESSTVVGPPRVADALVAMECRLSGVLRPGGDAVVVGEVVGYQVHDSLWRGGRIDQARLDPLARIAGGFAPLGTHFVV